MENMKIRDYSCFNDNPTTINPDVKQSLNLHFPDAYKEAKSMTNISKYIRQKNETPYATLPFCYTVEGEAFGGNVNYGDENIGPRGANPIFKNLEEFLEIPDIDFSKGRIKEVLDAIEILKEDGEDVILKVSGPIAVLNILTEPKNIFKTMRRNPELMDKVYEKIHRNIKAYIKEGINRGADIISYGDSAVSVSILGDKMMVQYIDNFLVNFLKDLENTLEKKVPIHICPKLTYGLIDSGRAEFVDVSVDENLNYGEAFPEVLDEGILIGSRCINNIKSHMKSGKIEVIKIK